MMLNSLVKNQIVELIKWLQTYENSGFLVLMDMFGNSIGISC